jgi:hypothetical protein
VRTAVLLASPLLPTVVHDPVLEAFGHRGWDVVAASAPPSPPGPQPVLAAFAGALARVRPELVLTHSNAGRYAAHVAGDLPTVHVDAALPDRSGTPVPLAPESLLAELTAMSEDGLLPPWTRWWPEEAIDAVVPDPAWLARIRAAERRMPLSYFRFRLGAPTGWADRSQAYLAFGDTYADETRFALERGWPVEVLRGARHLHQLLDPEAVAAAVLRLAAHLDRLRDGQGRALPGRTRPHGMLPP